MEANGDYDTGIESDDSDNDDEVTYSVIKMEWTKQNMLEAIDAHNHKKYSAALKEASQSSTSIETELPKIITKITKEMLNMKSQDANRNDIHEVEKMLACTLKLVNSEILEKSMKIMGTFRYHREVFLVACKYGILHALDHVLNKDETCEQLQLTLYEGIKQNVYSNDFSLCIIERIIHADLDILLTWDDVLDLVMQLNKDQAKQRVSTMVESKKDLGHHTLGRIFHYSCRYNLKELLKSEVLKNLSWKDIKTELEFCFTRKNYEEIGRKVLQHANGITPLIGNLLDDGVSRLAQTVLSDYMSYASDIGALPRNCVHKSVLKTHLEIFRDERIQYTEACRYNKNKLLSSYRSISFDISTVAVCEKCRERREQPNSSSIMQCIQTQHYLITKKFNQVIFENAVRSDNVILVAVLWKFRWKRMKKMKEITYRPFELPTALVRDFSTFSAGMQKVLRDMYCHEFTIRYWKDIVYVDLSMKTVNNGDLEKQRKEVILVAISHENSITTVIVEENQQRFGGIPVLWKSSAKFHASNNRSQVRLHGDISIPHYLKENLFRQHRNLTILTVSTNREIGNEVFEMKYPNYCVTLYCWAKGYVPVGEKEFPRTIGQFHTITDVREGYCCFATGNKIFPGGGIYSKSENKVGTFGGFVEKNDEIYGITCAHVLLNEHELTESRINLKPSVLAAGETEMKIGSLYCHTFEYGHSQNVSVDAALVKLDSNVEKESNFPKVDQDTLSNAGFCVNKPPVYDDGTTISVDEEPRNWVIKYGKTTGLTCGYLSVNKGTCARISRKIKLPFPTGLCYADDQMETDDDNENQGYMMYNQTEVYGVQGKSFFELGDSGSLVFKIMDGNKLRCLGLAFGRTSYGSALVTPIDNVLQSLSAKCPSASNQDGALRMKRFRREVQNVPRENNGNDLMSILLSQMQQLQSNIDDNMTRIEAKIEAKIDAKFSSVQRKMEEKFETVESDLQNIKACVFPKVSTPSDRQTVEYSDEDL